MELLAFVEFYEDYAPVLAGKSVWIYMDSNNSLSAVTKGDSDAEDIAILVAQLRKVIRRYYIRA